MFSIGKYKAWNFELISALRGWILNSYGCRWYVSVVVLWSKCSYLQVNWKQSNNIVMMSRAVHLTWLCLPLLFMLLPVSLSPRCLLLVMMQCQARPDTFTWQPKWNPSRLYVLQMASREMMPLMNEVLVELTVGQRTFKDLSVRCWHHGWVHPWSECPATLKNFRIKIHFSGIIYVPSFIKIYHSVKMLLGGHT